MKKVMVVILLILGGCTDTGAIQTGPNSYSISTRVPFGGPSSASGQALSEANWFCGSINKQISLTNISSYECALHGGCGEAQIFFQCLPR